MLIDACAAAGVRTGDHDDPIIEWLARWEPATCAVIAGLITRAHVVSTAVSQLAETIGPPSSRASLASNCLRGEYAQALTVCAAAGAIPADSWGDMGR
jgi:hypothetical protein